MRIAQTTRKGFTLAEVLIGIFVTVSMAAVVLATIVCLMNFFFGEVANAELKQKAFQSLGIITQDLRTADPDTIDVSTSHMISAYLATGWDSDGNLVYSSDETQYRLDADELVKENVATSDRRVLCNLVSEFNCTEYTDGHYSIEVVLSKDIAHRTITYTATKNFGLRNSY